MDSRPMYERAAELARQGLCAAEIQVKLGCKRSTIYSAICWARRAGVDVPPRLPQSPYRVGAGAANGDDGLAARLRPHAEAREVSVSALVHAIISRVVEDDLVDAVLDDMEISDD